MKIAVITNASVSVPVLQMLAGNRLTVAVFSEAGAGDPTEREMLNQYCKQANLQHQSANADSLYYWLEETAPDMAIVMGYTQLIDIKQLPLQLRNQIFNVHFGPLPSYRGPVPVFWQIKNGENNLAVSIHYLNEKFDAGAVVWTKAIRREVHMSYGVANMILPQITTEGISVLIQHYINKLPLKPTPKENRTSVYYKRPQLEDVRINWESMSAVEIINLVLACNPWNKGAITFFDSREMKIVDVEPSELVAPNSLKPGAIVSEVNSLFVVTKDNNLLSVKMLNIDGTFIPARHAAVFGLTNGQKFQSTL